MTEITYPRFLSNRPLGKDLFESGSQLRTARSIANHIKDKDHSFKLIGLEGNYGSGKSNVISIIKEELGETYQLFVYDAWSHQVDLQRRSFLEELTHYLQEQGILNKTKWENKLHTLLAKKKETRTKTVPKLSLAIIVSLLVAIATPVCNSLAGLLPDKSLWKPLVTAAPIIIALLVWLIHALKANRFQFTDLFFLYKEKELEQHSEETVSEREPSVTEFRTWMQELSNDIQKQVVVVFDNMDRLPGDKLQTAWSSVHTFFSEQSYPKIWVIVPFARAQINEAFDAKEKSNDKGNNFINKTFPVIFSVSPLVLTDWKGFLREKYTEAFGTTEDEEYNIIKNLFDIYSLTITPRTIITFVNDLVSLKLSWNSDIRLHYMALYVLNREHILNNPLQEILIQEFIYPARALFKDDAQLVDNLTALVYNVPLHNAAQVALSREITTSIRGKDIQKIATLTKERKFFEILEPVVQKEQIEMDALAATLDTLVVGDGDIISERILDDIWKMVINKFLDETISHQAFTTTHAILLKRCSKDRLPRIAGKIIHILNDEKITAVQYFESLHAMKQALTKQGADSDEYCTQLLPIRKVDATQFFEYLKIAKGTYNSYSITCVAAELDHFLTEKFPEKAEEYAVLSVLDNAFRLPKLQQKIEMAFSSMDDSDEVMKTLAAYKAAIRSKPIIGSKQLSDSQIEDLLINADEGTDPYYEWITMRLAKMDKFTGTAAINDTILGKEDEQFVKIIAEKIEWYTTYGNILLKTLEWKQPLIMAVGRHLTLHKINNSRLDIEKLLPSFFPICESIKVSPEQLLDRLNDWSHFAKTEVTIDKLPSIVSHMPFYDLCLNHPNELTEHILKVSIEYVIAMTDFVVPFIRPSSFEFQLIFFLLQNNLIAALPSAAMEGFKEALKEMAHSDSSPSLNYEEQYALLYNTFDKHHLATTAKDVRDLFIKEMDITPDKFLFFEAFLRTHGDLHKKSADVARVILQPIKDNSACLEVMAIYAEFYASLLADAKDDALDFIVASRKKIESSKQANVIITLLKEYDKIVSTKVKLTAATLIQEERSFDAIELVNKIIHSNATLHFPLDSELVENITGEALQNTRLEISYDLYEESTKKIFNQNEWVRIP